MQSWWSFFVFNFLSINRAVFMDIHQEVFIMKRQKKGEDTPVQNVKLERC